MSEQLNIFIFWAEKKSYLSCILSLAITCVFGLHPFQFVPVRMTQLGGDNGNGKSIVDIGAFSNRKGCSCFLWE
jgi:hypothetical protein